MKKYLLSLLVIYFFVVAIPVLAQNDNGATNQEPATTAAAVETNTNANQTRTEHRSRGEARLKFKKKLSERMDTLRADIQARRAETRSRVSEKVQERIYTALDTMIKRFEERVARLTDLADKLDARIEEREKLGLDMSPARTELDRAREEITASTDAISKVSLSTNIALSSETPREVIKEVREEIEAVRTNLKNARNALLSALKKAREIIRANDTGNTASKENGSE